MSVSETIGKLLLEGYKMLAESCDVCCTVLMQDRRGRIICVKCESTSMANAAQPDIMPSTGKLSNGTNGNVAITSINEENAAGLRVILSGSGNTMTEGKNPAISSTISSCESVLVKEISNAVSSLELLTQHNQDMQGKLAYIKYIRECAETIQSLRPLKKP